MFPCSGFSYQCMNYNFFSSSSVGQIGIKSSQPTQDLCMCHYRSNFSITKQDIGQFCNLVLSKANLKLDTFHSKMLDM